MIGGKVVFVRLELHASTGQILSRNFYWRADSDAGYRALNQLASAKLSIAAHLQHSAASNIANDHQIDIDLKNTGDDVALNTKLGVFASDGTEVLPAYFSDNYVSLLPGKAMEVAYAPLGVIVALTFVGLPFVVRTIQPVLEDLDQEYEEAAATLGASRLQTFILRDRARADSRVADRIRTRVRARSG